MTRRHGANRPRPDGEAEDQAHARAALERAESVYRQSVDQLSRRAVQARGVTVGDLIDGTLEFVRRHPTIGLLTAGVVGYLLGRVKRR